MSRSRPVAATVTALGLLLGLIGLGGAPAVAASAPAPGLQLVAQTPFVTASGTFSADLDVSAPDPADDTLQVIAYSRLTSRTGFSQALTGQPYGYDIWSHVVTQLGSTSGTSVQVQIPVNESVPAGDPSTYEFNTGNGSAVYPLVFQLYSSEGVPLGDPVTSFLVYSSGGAAVVPRLAVSLTVPVGGPTDDGPTITPLPSSAIPGLTALAAVLAAQPTVPVTLAVDPEVVDRLAAGPAGDRQILASIAGNMAADQVLPAPYYPVDGSALYAASLVSQLQRQYGAGAAALAGGLGQQPDGGAAVVTGGLDNGGLDALLSMGTARVVVPDADLSPLSAAQEQITFANPTTLAGSKGASAAVVGADAGLSAFLTPRTDPVLAGEQLLAGLSLVQLEAPSDARGVALIPPSRTAVDPTVLATVLAGLKGNPLLMPVTVDRLFAGVPAASPQVTRTLVDDRQGVPLAGADALRAAGVALDGLSTILPGDTQSIQPMQRQLLFASSSSITASGRASLLATIQAAIRKAEAGISLPGSSSVTLTATTGTIPLTVLSNPKLHARVKLQISSAKLAFRPFTTSLGTCTVTDQSTETCQLTLTSEATTLRIPVETRTSGVFSMQVTLGSPDGQVVLAANRDTVRSTAFSDVGVFLIVAAALGLLVWWVRNARHGRRARQLVDVTDDGVRLPDLEDIDGSLAAVVPPALAGPVGAPPVLAAPGAVPTGPVGPPTVPAEPAGAASALPPFPVADPDAPPAVPRAGSPAPAEPTAPGAEGAPAGRDGETANGWLDGDPVISEFFSSPAPDYGERAGGSTPVSPSGRRRGPNS